MLVVGAGEISALTAQHLRSQGVAEIVITSRTAAHADALAAQVGGRTVPWARCAARSPAPTSSLTATGSQRPIITREDVRGGHRTPAARSRCSSSTWRCRATSTRPSAKSSRCSSTTSTTCRAIVQENLARRGAEIARAEAIVAEEVARFTVWQRSRRAIPTVVALRQRFDDIRRAELRRLEPRLSGLPADARARVDEVTRLIVEKLLLEPTEQLKALPDEETQAAYTEAVNRLFRLGDGESAGSRRSRSARTTRRASARQADPDRPREK